MIDLYTAYKPPNGHKISICLEELKMPYTVNIVDIYKGEQFKDEFLALNTNAKVPVVVDQDKRQIVFESCAILLYLAEQAGQLVSPTGKAHWDAIQWIFFQSASIGPMFGQRANFELFAPEKIFSVINHYTKETERLCSVLEKRIQEREFICDEYSIVDIAHFSWIYAAKQAGFSLTQFPNLIAWHDQIVIRPAVAKGLAVPGPVFST